MKILIAATSFKGSLSAPQACRAIGKGIRKVLPDSRVTLLPVSDGGDSLLDSLAARWPLRSRMHSALVAGPMGKRVRSQYLLLRGEEPRQNKLNILAEGILSRDEAKFSEQARRACKENLAKSQAKIPSDKCASYSDAAPEGETVAFVETAKVCGLAMVAKNRRNPMFATSYGVGEMIAHIMRRHKVRKIYIGLGGTATMDGGCGMAQALGGKLLDRRGKEITLGCAGLKDLARVDISGIWAFLKSVSIIGLTDVRNPLLGKNGAAEVFAPQKGATPGQVRMIERNLAHFARVISRFPFPVFRFAVLPGAGAAGGLGFGLMVFCGAKLQPGVSTILDLLEARRLIKDADVVVVGEGRLDATSLSGKAPFGVSQMARSLGKKVVGIFGAVDDAGPNLPKRLGLASWRSLIEEAPGEKEAIQKAAFFLAKATENLFRRASSI